MIRPTSLSLAGARAAARFLTETGLCHGQSPAFFEALTDLAADADRAVRDDDHVAAGALGCPRG